MAGIPERNLQTGETDHNLIRNHIQNVVSDNYKPFTEGEVNPQHLVSIKYTGSSNRDIFFHNGNERIILPYGNLDYLIRDVFWKDRDLSVFPIKIKGMTFFSPYVGMPPDLSTHIGERLWQVRQLYKLKEKNPGERNMVIQMRFYDPVAKDTKPPIFEAWIAESGKSDSAADEEMSLKQIPTLT